MTLKIVITDIYYTMGKTAIITGANRGLGKAMTEELAQKGVKVIMVCRDKAKSEPVFSEFKNKGFDVELEIADMGDTNSIEEMAKRVKKRLSVIDIVINNAGLNVEDYSSTTIETIELETLQTTMNVNFYGVFWMCKMFVPLVKKSGDGRIVNFSSGLGMLTEPGMGPFPAYSISKTAVNAITTKLSSELKDTNVIVTSVDPGWVRTDLGGPDAELSIPEGIDTAIWLATAPASEIESGRFYKERKFLAW